MVFRYRCGHTNDPIIMNNDTMGMMWYLEWNDSEERKKKHMCFQCYLEKYNFPNRRDLIKVGKKWIHLKSEQPFLEPYDPIEGF